MRGCFKEHAVLGLNEKVEGNPKGEGWIVLKNVISRAAEERLGRKANMTFSNSDFERRILFRGNRNSGNS